MKGNFYDPIAFFYDPLSKVLGKSYQNSKYIFLDRIGRGDKVLYLGGGTGANLSSILEHIGEEGKIFYMEASRSEEHTSELQSRENLVCRLLLEKKKKI